MKYYWGVDAGSTAIKVALLNEEGEILALAKGKTLFPLIDHVRKTFNDSCFSISPFKESSELSLKPEHFITASGKQNHRNQSSSFGS
jgi:hypothetical protein